MTREIKVMFADVLMCRKMSDIICNNLQIRDRCIELMKTVSVKTNWNCNTFNSLDSFDLRQDPLFAPLIGEVCKEVSVVSNEFEIYSKDVKCVGAWFNVSSRGYFQEFHNHPMSHFSAVYYVDVPEDSGLLILQKNFSNMFPLPKPKHLNFLNSDSYKFAPQNQDLIIFKSDISHMVGPNNSDGERISISMNFILD